MKTDIMQDELIKSNVALTLRQIFYQKNRDKILERRKIYYESNKEKAKTYYEKNREKIAEHYQANRDKALEYRKSYRELNKKTIAEKNKTYKKTKNIGVIKNIVRKRKDEILSEKKEWRKNNKDKLSSYAKEWRKNNHDKTSHYHRVRRAIKRSALGSHSADDVQLLLVMQKNKCAVCHISILKGYHVDHVIPLAIGGTNDKWNLQLLCPTCNMSKGAKHPIDFMQGRGMLL